MDGFHEELPEFVLVGDASMASHKERVLFLLGGHLIIDNYRLL
jgi:hypothetical protein